jgi:molybdopterin-biosynthesis enzyme MoeA-like protein
MGVEMLRSPQAEALIRDFYKDKVNNERLRMADLPRGCELVSNSVTMAPGLKIDNIYVFAGIPRIMHAMFEAIEGELVGGRLMHERDIKLQVGEGEIAAHMRALLKEFPSLELGSYPRVNPDQDYRTHLIFKSLDEDVVEKAFSKFKILMNL